MTSLEWDRPVRLAVTHGSALYRRGVTASAGGRQAEREPGGQSLQPGKWQGGARRRAPQER